MMNFMNGNKVSFSTIYKNFFILKKNPDKYWYFNCVFLLLAYLAYCTDYVF